MASTHSYSIPIIPPDRSSAFSDPSHDLARRFPMYCSSRRFWCGCTCSSLKTGQGTGTHPLRRIEYGYGTGTGTSQYSARLPPRSYTLCFPHSPTHPCIALCKAPAPAPGSTGSSEGVRTVVLEPPSLTAMMKARPTTPKRGKASTVPRFT